MATLCSQPVDPGPAIASYQYWRLPLPEAQLVNMEEEKSRKRAASEEESGENHEVKRTRFVHSRDSLRSTASFVPTTTGNQFLFLHLQILRSLYDHTILDGEDATDETRGANVKDDGEVSDDFFSTIQKFLKERNKLRVLVEKGKMSKGVQDEAISFIKDENEIASAMTPISPVKTRDATIPNNMFSRSSSAMIPSQQSPYPHRFFSTSHRSEHMEINNGSLNLMAVLLRRKYLVADKTLKQQAQPFNAVLFEVRRRVQKIERLVSELNTDGVEEGSLQNVESSGKLADESQEGVARLETKLHLWNLLLLDLKGAA